MNSVPQEELPDPSAQEHEEYSSVSLQVIAYVAIGTALGLLLDHFRIFGFLAEGTVRAIAGTADTLGLTFAALAALVVGRLRNGSERWRKTLPDLGNPKAVTWVRGGLIGLVISFFVQGLVFSVTNDPHGPIGVIYAFGFSNLDNTIAGLSVLIAALSNHGWKEGWNRYWHHPFFVGNAFMLVVIPLGSLSVRLITGFRPDLNTAAGLEAGLMDIDSVGAALIFLVATRYFGIKVPYISESLTKFNTGFRNAVGNFSRRSSGKKSIPIQSDDERIVP